MAVHEFIVKTFVWNRNQWLFRIGVRDLDLSTFQKKPGVGTGLRTEGSRNGRKSVELGFLMYQRMAGSV